MQNAHAKGSAVSERRGRGNREERQLGFYLAFISFIYSHCEKLSGEARAVGRECLESEPGVGWEGGRCGRAGKLQVLLALVFVILPPPSLCRFLSHFACS